MSYHPDRSGPPISGSFRKTFRAVRLAVARRCIRALAVPAARLPTQVLCSRCEEATHEGAEPAACIHLLGAVRVRREDENDAPFDAELKPTGRW